MGSFTKGIVDRWTRTPFRPLVWEEESGGSGKQSFKDDGDDRFKIMVEPAPKSEQIPPAYLYPCSRAYWLTATVDSRENEKDVRSFKDPPTSPSRSCFAEQTPNTKHQTTNTRFYRQGFAKRTLQEDTRVFQGRERSLGQRTQECFHGKKKEPESTIAEDARLPLKPEGRPLSTS